MSAIAHSRLERNPDTLVRLKVRREDETHQRRNDQRGTWMPIFGHHARYILRIWLTVLEEVHR
jgi:hypothetical protein